MKKMQRVRRLGVVSAVVGLGCVMVLLVDYGIALGRAPGDKSRVEDLVKQVKTDPDAAVELHEERERQTLASMARETRSRVAAWVLLAAGGLFIACGKSYMSQKPQPLPSLEDLVATRFAPKISGNGSRAKTPAALPQAGEDGIDPSVVDDFIRLFGSNREAAIPILQAIQNHYRYLPDEALQHVCERTEITPAQIAGTSSFYAQFRRSPVGRYVVRVCHGTACHVAGAEQITQELRRHLDIPAAEDTDSRRLFTIDAVACLGCCSLAPVMMVEEETAGHLTPAGARQVLDTLAPGT